MARCVTFTVARIHVGNKRNFAYFFLRRPKYGRRGIQKGLHGSDQIWLWSINRGRLYVVEWPTDIQTDRQTRVTDATDHRTTPRLHARSTVRRFASPCIACLLFVCHCDIHAASTRTSYRPCVPVGLCTMCTSARRQQYSNCCCCGGGGGPTVDPSSSILLFLFRGILLFDRVTCLLTTTPVSSVRVVNSRLFRTLEAKINKKRR